MNWVIKIKPGESAGHKLKVSEGMGMEHLKEIRPGSKSIYGGSF